MIKVTVGFSSPCSGNYVKLHKEEFVMNKVTVGFSSPCSGNYVKLYP